MMRRSATPNVVVILVDTTRADRLSCYGHARQTTPCIDALARESMVYTQAISPGAWTPPSHASIFTGTYASRHGVDRTHPYLDTPMTTLPEYLRGRGYRTYGISSNYWISTATCYDRGFDVFYQSWQLLQAGVNPALERQRRRDPGYTPPPAPLGDRLRAAVNRADAAFWRTCCSPFMAIDMGAARVNRVVRRWMGQWARREQPFFAFIHYLEPHLPYRPPTRYVRRYLSEREARRARTVNQNALKYIGGRAVVGADDMELLGRLYDAEISYTDQCIGELVDGLRTTGLLDDTLLVLTSDHGENLGEHGLMDHMFSVHEPIVRVPLIVRFPGGTPRGQDAGLVQTLDVFPTVVAALDDAAAPVAEQFQGAPLPPLGPRREFAVTELNQVQPPIETIARRYPGFDWRVYDRSLCALRTATHKYVQGSDGREELYALDADPGETRDLSAADPALTAEMRGRLAAWRASFTPAAIDGAAPELDSEIRRRLHDLGYIED
jgi:arylsulfatase A-like enzyme